MERPLTAASARRRPRRLAPLLIAPTVVALLAWLGVARWLDFAFFHGLSVLQSYSTSAAIVSLALFPPLLLTVALMRWRLMRLGGRRYLVPQEWSAAQLRSWQSRVHQAHSTPRPPTRIGT
ncbi:MAG: hypothetical protein ABI629_16025 [bacterium]